MNAKSERQKSIRTISHLHESECEICKTAYPKNATWVSIDHEHIDYQLWICPACIRYAARLVEGGE